MNTTEKAEIVERVTHSGRIELIYTRIAKKYDRMTRFEIEHHKEAAEIAAVRPGDRVLEVACGTGRGTVELLQRLGDHDRMDALDLTPGMIDEAKKKTEELGLASRVLFQQGDARKLPFLDNTFDILYNSYMFDLIDAPGFPQVLAEFFRVLRPGGRIVLVNMSKKTGTRTFYEAVYERGWLGSFSGSCRPVLMKSWVEGAGFERVFRLYRRNTGYTAWFVGTEIVAGIKPRESLV